MNIIIEYRNANDIKKEETILYDVTCIEYDKQKNKIILTYIDGTQKIRYCKFNEDIETVIKIKIWKD